MSTKKYLAEQALYRLKAGYESVASSVDERDMYAAIGQIINTTFKMQHFSQTMAAGETIPDGLVIATYNNIAVSSFGKRAKATLPVMPVSLPRNMGILEVSTDAQFSCLLKPLRPGEFAMLQNQGALSSLLNQIGYEVYGSDIILTQNITINNQNAIYLRLVVNDVNSLSIYDPLPVPADYENQIIDELVKRFAPVTSQPKLVDSYTETK